MKSWLVLFIVYFALVALLFLGISLLPLLPPVLFGTIVFSAVAFYFYMFIKAVREFFWMVDHH